MDSDWCLFCEKHVNDPGALYCSKECSRMDKLSSASKSSNLTPATSSAASTSITPSTRRLAAHSPMTVTYSMFRPSTLVPSSMASRGGVSKPFTPIPAATTSIRCLPSSRGAVRRQPLVLG
ncbi:hypothetical protein BGZ93_006392 [Podila epicladia]|nr:hypothetical protein BGZ92_009332 [Podila epicladia]KAG0095060.1 hypothetical protein BGZ93_006392 [Podila epicladia]